MVSFFTFCLRIWLFTRLGMDSFMWMFMLGLAETFSTMGATEGLLSCMSSSLMYLQEFFYEKMLFCIRCTQTVFHLCASLHCDVSEYLAWRKTWDNSCKEKFAFHLNAIRGVALVFPIENIWIDISCTKMTFLSCEHEDVVGVMMHGQRTFHKQCTRMIWFVHVFFGGILVEPSRQIFPHVKNNQRVFLPVCRFLWLLKEFRWVKVFPHSKQWCLPSLVCVFIWDFRPGLFRNCFGQESHDINLSFMCNKTWFLSAPFLANFFGQCSQSKTFFVFCELLGAFVEGRPLKTVFHTHIQNIRCCATV